MAKFERHFAGKDNAGVRKLIRDAANGAVPACGPSVERAIRAATANVAFTAAGRANLDAVVADYRRVWPDFERRCACDSCVAGSLQGLGAHG